MWEDGDDDPEDNDVDYEDLQKRPIDKFSTSRNRKHPYKHKQKSVAERIAVEGKKTYLLQF
jgi:hypothetical protein